MHVNGVKQRGSKSSLRPLKGQKLLRVTKYIHSNTVLKGTVRNFLKVIRAFVFSTNSPVSNSLKLLQGV